MDSAKRDPVANLQKFWRVLKTFPAGKWVFSRMLGWMVPYSGSVGAKVLDLRPGYAKLSLRDRRKVRNHLNSIHAIALANLGELTSGLAMLSYMDTDIRAIITGITIDYYKKARGTLVAECQCEIPRISGDTEYVVQTEIKDLDNDVVCCVSAKWRLGLRQ